MLKTTTSDKVVRFKSTPEKDQFIKVLRQRVDNYFKEKGISKYANREMKIKGIVAAAAWVAVYATILSNVLSPYPWALILGFMALGFVNIFIAFNIVHDACHLAYSANKKVNKYLGLSMNFIGGNAYLFTMMHNAHHAFVNIHGIDVTLESHGTFRFTPHEPYRKMHRWQHIYTPILYMMAMIHWAVIKDWKWFYQERHIGNQKNIQHPKSEFWWLLAGKIVYFGLTLVIPMLVLDAAWYWILLGWVNIHLLPGLTFAVIFQATHVYNGTTYPLPDKDGNIDNNYAIHVLATTADFSRKSRVGTWLMGGINLHVIHHILPTVCHVHYPQLTQILKETCDEYGIEYQENPNLWVAFRKHMEMLKILSHPDAYVPEYRPNAYKLGV
jgi:linoleoyl-CoA desaturase